MTRAILTLLLGAAVLLLVAWLGIPAYTRTDMLLHFTSMRFCF